MSFSPHLVSTLEDKEILEEQQCQSCKFCSIGIYNLTGLVYKCCNCPALAHSSCHFKLFNNAICCKCLSSSGSIPVFFVENLPGTDFAAITRPALIKHHSQSLVASSPFGGCVQQATHEHAASDSIMDEENSCVSSCKSESSQSSAASEASAAPVKTAFKVQTLLQKCSNKSCGALLNGKPNCKLECTRCNTIQQRNIAAEEWLDSDVESNGSSSYVDSCNSSPTDHCSDDELCTSDEEMINPEPHD